MPLQPSPSHIAPPEDLEQQTLDCLRQWHAPSPAAHPWQAFSTFSPGASLRAGLNRILLAGLDQLAQENSQAAQVLRLRFADEMTAYQAANRLNVVEGTVYKWQREAVNLLAETLWRMEQESRRGRQDELSNRLPPPTYTRLFGVDGQLASLRETLLSPGLPWLVAVESMGGMGKTTLADALCRWLIQWGESPELAWVTAQEQQLSLGGVIQPLERPALTSAQLVQALAEQLLSAEPDYATLSQTQKQERLAQHFKAAPHLVVVDNLETLADVDALLGHLRRWANPTKFLLTTRRRLLAEADIHHFTLPELGQDDALALVRHEAGLRNLPDVAAAPDATLNPIYDCVGGNPLALRLVVGQLHVHPLPTVLADLRGAHGDPVSGLYSHIYAQAWQALNENARRVLLAMPLVPPDGGELDLLAAISQLPPDDLRSGLAQLVRRNLIDARGDLYQRRYSIHSLTRTFLHEQVLHWQ